MMLLRDDPRFAFEQLHGHLRRGLAGAAERFEVVYNLLSLTHNRASASSSRPTRRRRCRASPALAHGATWFERETWDMYGVVFAGQADLRRLLTDYGFEGHPLRKDFPLTGFVELRYDEELKRVAYEPVKLTQDFRNFDFLSPWEAMTTLPGDEKVHLNRLEGRHERPEVSLTRRRRRAETGGRAIEVDSHTINFGPQHPAAHGVLRLILEMKGEVVERADPHIGLLHRGTEKLIEHKTYIQALPYFDRLDYVSPMCMEHSFALATERLLGIEVPERARTSACCSRADARPEPPAERDDLCARLRRDHAGALGLRAARDAAGILRGGRRQPLPRELLPPGGVAKDLPAGWRTKIAAWAQQFPKFLDDLEGLLTENRIFKQRTVDIGVMTAEQAMAWGFSGPCLRASGCAWDLRKSQPYESMTGWNSTCPSARMATATTAT
jgi:NADH:ubiquinone oxidoreductase subunit C